MALVVGTNTYVTLAEAIAYFESRYNSSFFAALTATQQEQLLISATRALDVFCDSWNDSKYDADQLLEFPRGLTNTIPEKIKIAQYEIATSIYDNDSVSEQNEAGLKKLKADVVEFEFLDVSSTTSTLYSLYTKRLLRSFCGSYGVTFLLRA